MNKTLKTIILSLATVQSLGCVSDKNPIAKLEENGWKNVSTKSSFYIGQQGCPDGNREWYMSGTNPKGFADHAVVCCTGQNYSCTVKSYVRTGHALQ